MAKLYCENLDLEFVQKKVLLKHEAESNPYLLCNEIPDINFKLWSEYPYANVDEEAKYEKKPKANPEKEQTKRAENIEEEEKIQEKKYSSTHKKERKHKALIKYYKIKDDDEHHEVQTVVTKMPKKNETKKKQVKEEKKEAYKTPKKHAEEDEEYAENFVKKN